MQIPDLLVFGAAAAIILATASARSASIRARRLDKDLAEEKQASRRKDEELAASRKTAEEVQRRNDELARLLGDKSKAMPWIAGMVADLYWVQDKREARYLETKKRPARSAAEEVRAHGREKKALRLAKRLVE